MGEKVQVCVPVCGPMGSVPLPFVTCIPMITAMLHNIPGITERRWTFDPHFPVDSSRNHLVRQAKEWGADWTLWLDADMSFPDEMVASLFEVARQNDAKIVSGIYFKKRPPFIPVAMVANKDNPGFYNAIDPVTCKDKVVTVDLIGMGCALIHMSVFDQLPAPWFKYNIRKATGWAEVSEDVHFCESARAAGFDILVYTGLICPHWTTTGIGLEHWEAYRGEAANYQEEL